MLKKFSANWKEGNILNVIKNMYEKTVANIICNGEIWYKDKDKMFSITTSI